MLTRVCTRCGETKQTIAFGSGKRSKGGYRNQCRACLNASKRAQYDPVKNRNFAIKYRMRDPERRRRYNLKAQYNITPEDYAHMAQAQNNCCYICHRADPASNNGAKYFHIDHCHNTGKVRKLLCTNCNNGLGRFFHRQELLRKAADYLDTYK